MTEDNNPMTPEEWFENELTRANKPTYKELSIPLKHPEHIDSDKIVEIDGEEKIEYARGVYISVEDMYNYYYSLEWMRKRIGAGGQKVVIGKFMYAIYEFETNNNAEPFMELFWELVGKHFQEEDDLI